MNFKEFSTIFLKEAKFRETSQSLVDRIKKMAKIYDEKYRVLNDKDLPKMAKTGIIEDITKSKQKTVWEIYFKSLDIKSPRYFKDNIGFLIVKDLATNKNVRIQFVVIYGDVTTNYASYSENFQVVNLFNENLKDLPLARIESLILHELTHSFQQYKEMSDRYSTELDKPSSRQRMSIYYKEPIEFDSHLNEIAYTITQRFNMLSNGVKKARDPVAKKVLQNRLELFLQEIKILIKADPESYFKLKELMLPSYLEDFEYFIKIIKDDQRLWKKFKTKLVNLYSQLNPEFS